MCSIADGDTISVAKGTVSRVEYKEYVHSSTKLMTIHIDAHPARETNGGPVYIGNNFVGSYCQYPRWVETINVGLSGSNGKQCHSLLWLQTKGLTSFLFCFCCSPYTDRYIIPTPLIKHFLNGVGESGQYIGFGSLDISCQGMNDAQIRRHFKMSHGMTGILINEIHPLSYASKVLKEHDVILAIDGVPIGNDETGKIAIYIYI